MSADSVYERRFRARLAQVRKARGLSQARLAREAGVERSRLGRIETAAGCRVRLDEAVVIAEALEVPLEAMIGPQPVPVTVTMVD